MADFVDQLMVRYLNDANVDALLLPAADPTGQRVRALLASVYQPRLLTVEAVDSVTVNDKRFQAVVTQPVTARGTWEKVIPQGERALATVELPALAQTFWIDMTLDTMVSVRVSATDAPLESVDAEEVPVPGAASFARKYTLQYADPPVYNPADPAAVRAYRLRVSALFFPTLDLAEALRQLARTRRAADALMPRPDGYEGGDILGSGAWLAVFPDGAVGPGTPTKNEISALLGAERFIAAFETV